MRKKQYKTTFFTKKSKRNTETDYEMNFGTDR